VTARPPTDRGHRADALEQFGLQPLDAVQFAFAEGWHEDELQPRTGLRWRWSAASLDQCGRSIAT
jgi:hypothetical protein